MQYWIGGLLIIMISGGCASRVTVAPGCAVIAEVRTGTTIRCVEIERDSVDKSIKATGEAVGGALRGLLLPPGGAQ